MILSCRNIQLRDLKSELPIVILSCDADGKLLELEL